MGKAKDFKAIILVDDYLIPFLNKIATDSSECIVFRGLPTSEREKLLRETYNSLIVTLYQYLVKNNYASCNFTYLIVDYAQKLKAEKREKELRTLRWNISDIIIFTEQNYIYNETQKELNLLVNDVISCFRSLMLHIDIINQEDILKEIGFIRNELNEIENESVQNSALDEINKNLRDNIKLSSEKVISIGNSVRDILPQAITVLGIFVAIILVFIGDIKILDSVKLIKGEPFIMFISVVLLVVHLTLNLLFALLFLISRIAKSSINVRCSKFRDISPYYRNQVHHFDIDNKQDVSLNDELANQLMDLNQELRSITNDRRICANCAYADVQRSNERGSFGYKDAKDEKEQKEFQKLNKKDFSELTKEDKDKIFIQKNIDDQCGHMDRFIRKYPYIFFTNILCFLIEIIILFWYLITEVFYHNLKFEIIDPLVASICLVSFAIALIAIVSIIFYSLGKPKASSIKKEYKVIVLVLSIILIIVTIIAFKCGFKYTV